MSKHYRPWKIDQTLLLPPSVHDFVPHNHVARFIVAMVRDSLDLKAFDAAYPSPLGQPPLHQARGRSAPDGGAAVARLYERRAVVTADRESVP